MVEEVYFTMKSNLSYAKRSKIISFDEEKLQ